MGSPSDLCGFHDPVYRRAADCRQCLVSHPAFCLLALHDCVDEEYGGKVAEALVWTGIRGVLRAG